MLKAPRSSYLVPFESLVKAADAALYRAKRSDRNAISG